MKIICKSQDIRDVVKNFQTQDDPENVLKSIEPKLEEYKNGNWKAMPNDPLYKALTLSEFSNGALLISSIPEHFRTFAIDMMRKLQQEHSLTTVSEKGTAEIAVLAFVRCLRTQSRITHLLERDSLSETDITFISILSKELDRANRHYLSAIQTLNMQKRSLMKVNIKTNTAIIGEKQIIQENQNVTPI